MEHLQQQWQAVVLVRCRPLQSGTRGAAVTSTQPVYDAQFQNTLVQRGSDGANFLLQAGRRHAVSSEDTSMAFYNANGHRFFSFGNDVDRIPQGDPAVYCQCVGFVLNHLGLSGGIGGNGLAKDMGGYLNNHGFHQVSDASPGSVVIFQPSFGAAIDQSAGHVGIISSARSVGNGSQWSISVLGANQGGSLFGQTGCNDVSAIEFKAYSKSTTSVTYWSR